MSLVITAMSTSARSRRQSHGRVEVRGRRALGLDAAAPDGRAEDRRVMAGRPRLVDGAHEPREERVGAEAGGDPQGLATHLAAGRPELRYALHRIESRV